MNWTKDRVRRLNSIQSALLVQRIKLQYELSKLDELAGQVNLDTCGLDDMVEASTHVAAALKGLDDGIQAVNNAMHLAVTVTQCVSGLSEFAEAECPPAV